MFGTVSPGKASPASVGTCEDHQPMRAMLDYDGDEKVREYPTGVLDRLSPQENRHKPSSTLSSKGIHMGHNVPCWMFSL